MKRFLSSLSKRNDVFLAFLLICIVFMMILPLPTQLVDVLIGINLSLSAILLMVAIYLRDVTALSAFPSILLLTTLFRLALSITTTRLILLEADAGQIVETFGNFVVAGNLVVGAVIFLILTIVNFLVITKGSERVAEVAARFSLDAMPGKQMSIDSDMRAGLIDMDEAKARRGKLEKESQLYGAMDGAMKFVKGDAIAGLIIIFVNIIGGMTIGTMQRGMTSGEALEVYAILTIGDGLVSQIPALFISITAGFIVTRVASEDNENLGEDIGNQVMNEPKALLIAAAILIGFALVPGFPTPVFLGLAALVGGGGLLISRNRKREADVSSSRFMPALAPANAPDLVPALPAEAKSNAPIEKVEPVTFALTVPLIVDISPSVRGYIDPRRLDAEVAKVRRALYFDLGVPFPGVHLRLNDSLDEDEYRILVNEIPVAVGRSRPGHVIVRETPANLEMFKIPYEPGEDFLPNTKSLWVSVKHEQLLRRADLQVMNLPRMLTFHLAHVLKSYAGEFVGVQETMYLLGEMEKNFAELVREVNRTLPVITIADVLQRLVSEEISIRDLRTILEALVEWGQREKDPILLTEHVRSALSRYITHKFAGGQSVISAYLLSKAIEDEVRGAIRQTSGASYLTLSPDSHRKLVAALKATLGDLSRHTLRPVILTPMDIRRFLRKLVERDFPELAVLSFQELTPQVSVQPLDRIEFR
ncbi:type III secretion system export apparatus subunit SctV [Roseicyclus amphidinii]|uniref:type III secretion system export apparatus subunit SctV n=1 Tax=Roseicyclus amphidinii TaxID=3034232 RepID=UPI0024E1689E|nr:type III secretion system export apparatus subunit SctV [Roseicyclus sp. Amp-Y-6]